MSLPLFVPAPLARIAIRSARGERHVVARERFEPGETILHLEGSVFPAPTRYTIQIGEHEHLGFSGGSSADELAARHPWCFLDHSCTPNARVDGRALVALARIDAPDEVSFDYETTEWELSEPFPCRCGRCAARPVRGFRFLDRAERERRRPQLAAHLVARLQTYPE